MSRGFNKNLNLTKEIVLRLAVAGCFIIAATTSPFFMSALIRAYFSKKSRENAWRAAERLRELSKKKIVSVKELPNGEIRVNLTHKGEVLVRQYKLEELQIVQPKKWDKNWRVIIYDIPHSHKNARDAFRMKIKDLGLYQLQKSVWVSPYDCFAEIEFLCGVFDLDLNKHVLYFKTPEIPSESKIIRHFCLRFSKNTI